MTVNHDAVAALPTSGAANKTLLRNVLVARMPYVLADGDNGGSLIAIDPSTGAIIVDLLLLGRVFHYDPADSTTAADGTTCLVSADGLRYKLAVGTDVFAYSVLDNTIATPPVSPSLGDAYLVAAAATGAWAGKSNFIAIKTARGWEFVNFGIGRFIYVESVDSYYHKNTAGNWVTGIGSQTIGANSVPLSAAINFGKRLIVENQTTTSPPSSPTVGTAYVIGPSATGGWAGDDGKIAICEVAGSFVIYTPTNGWEAYDKARNNNFDFNGSAWVSASGAFSATARTDALSHIVVSASIPVDDTIPQITEGTQILTLTYTPRSVTSKLRCRFRGSVTHSSAAYAIVALFLNTNANALCTTAVEIPSADFINEIDFDFEFVPGVTSSITLSVRAGPGNGLGTIAFNGQVANRLFGGTMVLSLIVDEVVA